MSQRRAAVVTGAGSGIGRAVALALAREGWLVAAIDRTPPAEAPFDADRMVFYQADVTREQDIAGVLGDFAARNDDCLDLLVNSAGVLATGDFETVPVDDYADLLAVNNFGIVVCCAKAFPYLSAAARAGRRPGVVNVASASALIGVPSMAVYSASKFWVIGFTEAIATEWRGHGIAVRDVLPPFVNTAMLQGRHDNRLLARLGAALSAEQVADEILQAARRGPIHRLVTWRLKALNLASYLIPRRLVRRLLAAAAGY